MYSYLSCYKIFSCLSLEYIGDLLREYKVGVIFLLLYASLLADEIDDLKKASLSNVNALIILTSQDMLTSGRYSFDDDATLHIINFPLYYHFDPVLEGFNFFANGSLGYSKLDDTININDYAKDDELIYETVALRFGGGARYISSWAIQLMVGFDFIYSRIRNIYDYNTIESQQQLKPYFDTAFANQYSNAYTYELFWQVAYTPVWAEWKPYVLLTINYFDTKQKLSYEELRSFHSTSGGSCLKFGFETPQFVHIAQTGLSAEFYVAGNAFAGDVRETLGFDGYGSSAAMLHLYIESAFYGEMDEILYKIPSILNRIDLMVEEVEGDGIRGYNIGLSAGFTF